MENIPLEAQVECADGPCGTSVAVIVNPTTQTVTHLVVQDKSLLDSDERLVPIDQVKETTPDLVRLRCTKADLAEMESFIERQYVQDVYDDPAYWYAMNDIYMEPYVTPIVPPYEQTEHIPPGTLAIRRGNWVEATDGHVGTVGELVVDPNTQHITHLVLQEGHLWGKKEIILPLSALDRVEADTIHLKLDKKSIAELPSMPIKRHWGRDKTDPRSAELVARVYDGPEGASQGLEFIEDQHRRKTLKILNAAVLVKEMDGTTSVKDVRDLEPKKGRWIGAITGGLVGLVGGPVGVVVGALAGVGAGSLAAKWIDRGFSDQFLAGLQERLQPGKSALIILVEQEWAHPLSEALSDDGGIILQQTLTDELVQELMKESEQEE